MTLYKVNTVGFMEKNRIVNEAVLLFSSVLAHIQAIKVKNQKIIDLMGGPDTKHFTKAHAIGQIDLCDHLVQYIQKLGMKTVPDSIALAAKEYALEQSNGKQPETGTVEYLDFVICQLDFEAGALWDMRIYLNKKENGTKRSSNSGRSRQGESC